MSAKQRGRPACASPSSDKSLSEDTLNPCLSMTSLSKTQTSLRLRRLVCLHWVHMLEDTFTRLLPKYLIFNKVLFNKISHEELSFNVSSNINMYRRLSLSQTSRDQNFQFEITVI